MDEDEDRQKEAQRIQQKQLEEEVRRREEAETRRTNAKDQERQSFFEEIHRQRRQELVSRKVRSGEQVLGWEVLAKSRSQKGTPDPEHEVMEAEASELAGIHISGSYDQVAITGLRINGELNGQVGVCGMYDELTDRWVVRIPSGRGLKLKSANVVPLDAEDIENLRWSNAAIEKATAQSSNAQSSEDSKTEKELTVLGPDGQVVVPCRAGHVMLITKSTAASEYACDVCYEEMPVGVGFLYCSGCDYALCRSCAGVPAS